MECKYTVEYFNLDITIMDGHFPSSGHAGSSKVYPITATFAKGGEAKAAMQLPFDEQTLAERLADVEEGLYNVQAINRASPPEKEQKIQNFGQGLFNALFCGHIYTLYETVKQGLNRKNEERLRIRLRIHPPELAILPWELMYHNDPEAPYYLCLDHSISLVRYQELRNPYSPLQVELPLYILGMVAIPKDQNQLDIKSEKEAIKKQLKLKPLSDSVKLNWLSGSGWDDLRKAMRRGPWHIFHFIGHGSFNTDTNEGFIALVDTNGNSVPINARDLGLLLDHPSLRLIILNSCKGAYGNDADAFSSTASILARRNIPAIIAMQYEITDHASIKFAGAFYGTLAKGEPIDAALFEARLALKGIPFSMEWAIPVLHMRSRDGNLFTLTSEPPDSLKQEEQDRLRREQEEQDRLRREQDRLRREQDRLRQEQEEQDRLRQEQEKQQKFRLLAQVMSRMPFTLSLFTRKHFYVLLASMIIFTLILGGVFALPSILHGASTDLFPALCSGNFQSANTARVPTPPTSTSPDREPIGLSEGANIFDLQRPNQQEVQDKLQAAQAMTNNPDPQKVIPSLENAISSDQTDAEAQIYLENWNVLRLNHPHITFVVGVSFVSSYGGSNVLQGAFTAQKECNDHNQQDDSKTQIILMIANIGGDLNGNITDESAKLVADQIVDQARKDSTIVGIMGWPTSAATIDVQNELQAKGSNLPLLAACSTSDDLTGTSHFFRICPTDKEQAQVAANFVLKTKQKKSIATLYQSGNSWSQSLERDFFEKAKANIVGQEGYIAGDQGDIQRALNNALTRHPDAIFFAGYPSDLVKLLNVIPQANNLLIIGGSALSITNAYANPLPDPHNVYFTAFASPNQWDGPNPKPLFFQEYKDHFGTYSTGAGFSSIDAGVMLGYDGMLTLLHGSQQVLSMKSTISASDLEGALKEITGANAIQGVTGRIAFESNGNQDPSKIIFMEHINKTNLVRDEKHGCLQKDKCGL